MPEDASGKESHFKFWLGIAIVPSLIAAAAIIAQFVIAPLQEVRGEKEKQAEEARQLSKKGALHVKVEESWNNDTDITWLFYKPLSREGVEEFNKLPVSSFEGIKKFAESHSGQRVGFHCTGATCDASKTRFKLRLTGHRQRPVQITQMSARIIKKSEPPRGARIDGPSAGLEDVQAGIVFLDSEDLRLKALREDGTIGRPLFDEKFVYVERGEPVVFEIFAASRSSAFEWEIQLDLLVEGKAERLTVRSDGTPNGKPFRTPGRIHSPSRYGVYGSCEITSPVATCKAAKVG
ncbi:hypothetical protein GCM10009678_28990 [Actinomadura kijaniata]|uniref:Uncharacterized protein n=1 Tax=Actinomadura namibiensis TaxID=182080 RepID=A0A7W3LK10_ACTNM|nr:hypothetical protein [Actinomadura namibiensis]MBA8949502.1 hypothetical protein [Actinomadura namibiensis]